jgi:hypothetical protein
LQHKNKTAQPFSRGLPVTAEQQTRRVQSGAELHLKQTFTLDLKQTIPLSVVSPSGYPASGCERGSPPDRLQHLAKDMDTDQPVQYPIQYPVGYCVSTPWGTA